MIAKPAAQAIAVRLTATSDAKRYSKELDRADGNNGATMHINNNASANSSLNDVCDIGEPVFSRSSRDASPGSIVEMTLGGGLCSEELRLVIQSMQREERSMVTFTHALEPLLGMASAGRVEVEVELLSFKQARSRRRPMGSCV